MSQHNLSVSQTASLTSYTPHAVTNWLRPYEPHKLTRAEKADPARPWRNGPTEAPLSVVALLAFMLDVAPESVPVLARAKKKVLAEQAKQQKAIAPRPKA